jgi:hypothetical protein
MRKVSEITRELIGIECFGTKPWDFSRVPFYTEQNRKNAVARLEYYRNKILNQILNF